MEIMFRAERAQNWPIEMSGAVRDFSTRSRGSKICLALDRGIQFARVGQQLPRSPPRIVLQGHHLFNVSAMSVL